MLKIQHKSADTYSEEQPILACSTEAQLISTYGSDALAFLGLTSRNAHFLAPDGAGLVNYRLARKVAVVAGDPICAPEEFEQVTRKFLAFCASQHWRVAFYQTNPDHLASYRSLKMRTFKMGEEAMIHPQAFTLSGSALANVRTSCRRAEREGVHIQWYEGIPPIEVVRQLEHVSNTWLKSKAGAETGFSVGRLDELMNNAELAERIANAPSLTSGLCNTVPRFVTAIAVTSSGQECAFVTFTPIYGLLRDTASEAGNHPRLERQDWGWALDLMRRMPDAPPGVMELLLVRAIERFRTCGAQAVSLGLVAMADTRQEMTSGERWLTGFLSDRLGFLDSRRTLFGFKQKFNPSWESRYLVANTTLALPKIALALLHLRNYSGGRLASLLMRGMPFWRHSPGKQ